MHRSSQKHRKLIIALLALPAIGLATTASAADGLSYNYVQGGYAATSTDGADAEGFAGEASFAFHPNFHAFGGYNSQEIDDSSVDLENWRAGIGYNHPIAANTDLLTRVAYENYQADEVGLDEDGWSAEVGVRSAMTPNLEGYALAGYEDGDDFDGSAYGRVGAQVKFSPNWGVTGDVKFADGDTQWFVGPRFTW
jgi:Ax21 family sulfation-dependent quorum factor